MARPRKKDVATQSTRDRILESAILLYSERGIDMVSIRDITSSCGIRESSLYNHFAGKDDLLTEVFHRLDQQMIRSALPDARSFVLENAGNMSLADILTGGGSLFFSKADTGMLRIWRILMTSQYRYTESRDAIRDSLLDAPLRFFSGLVSELQKNGTVRTDVDCEAAASCIASIFFDFSFRSNLSLAWGQFTPQSGLRLKNAIRIIADALETGTGKQERLTELSVRRATEADIDSISDVWYACALEESLKDTSKTLVDHAREKYRTYLEERLADPNYQILVCTHPGTGVIGYITGKKNDDPPVYRSQKSCIITELGVARDWRDAEVSRLLENSLFNDSFQKRITDPHFFV